MAKDTEKRAQNDLTESFRAADATPPTDVESETEKGAAGKRLRNAAARRARRSLPSPWAASPSPRGSDARACAGGAPGASEPCAKESELITIAAALISGGACGSAALGSPEPAPSPTADAVPVLHLATTPALSEVLLSGPSKRFYAYAGASIAAGMVIGFLSSPLVGSKSLDREARGEAASASQVVPWRSEIASLQEELRALRTQIEAMRQAAGSERASERLAALETSQGIGLEANRASEQANVDASARIGALEARLDRVERLQADMTPTGAIQGNNRDGAAGKDETRSGESNFRKSASNAPNSVISSAAVAKSEAQMNAVRSAIPPGGYILREVAGGVALVEGRDGRVKVARGDSLAGAGRVMAIERRGGEWMVFTSRGVIDSHPY